MKSKFNMGDLWFVVIIALLVAIGIVPFFCQLYLNQFQLNQISMQNTLREDLIGWRQD